MHAGNFINIADQLLDDIADTIEAADLEGAIDVEYGSGVLSLKLELGTYVLNKQSSKQEIWLSSPISGPYHFYQADSNWQDAKGNKLLQILNKELKIDFSGIKIEILDAGQ